jgi:16S rRNA (adenine1518-N6/adenine1519-N6)-dimethyltransferase
MNLASRQTIEVLCKKYNFWPRRESGQNFLISEKVLHSIVESAQLNSADTVLEIGGGFGTLTNELISRADSVITVELDKRLSAALKKIAGVSHNLKVIEGDVFKQWPVISSQLVDKKYKLVANLPYNITSFVLRNFLENKPKPSAMTLLVQKEVAERVTAGPGEMSILSVAVQFFGRPEIISLVPRENFWPQPEVDSAILKISEIGDDAPGYQKMLGAIPVKKFFSVVKIGFSAKRKQLHNNLSAGFRRDNAEIEKILSLAGVKAKARAQDLSLENWTEIAIRMDKKS